MFRASQCSEYLQGNNSTVFSKPEDNWKFCSSYFLNRKRGS